MLLKAWRKYITKLDLLLQETNLKKCLPKTHAYGFSAVFKKELPLYPYFNQVHFGLNLLKLPIKMYKLKV